jgi:hypothetical protein
MFLSSSTGWLKAARWKPKASSQAQRSRRARCVPRLELLEDRTVPSAFTVRNLLDSGNGSLRAAISSGDDTIAFAPGLHGTITLNSELPINHAVTINGPGANKLSVSGNGASRVFDISGNVNVTVAGLTITDGLAAIGGGILLEGSASLSISNCALTDNEAIGNAAGGGFGGGIEDTSSGALTVTNGTFNANKAIGVGPNSNFLNPPGYILALGGAIDVSLNSTGPAKVSNSTFTGNQALGGVPGASAGGGALSNSSIVGATMTVTGSTFSDNAAIGAAGGDGVSNFGSGQGGAINDFSSLIVRDSTLTGNLALGTPLAPGVVPSQGPVSGTSTAGGGICCLPITVPTATVTVADSTLAGNRAVGGAGAAGSAGSVGEGGGMALIFVPSGLVTGCTLVGNVAHGGAGGTGGVGALGVSGGIDLVFASVAVSNSILVGNEAIGGAGGAGANAGDGVGGGIDVGTGVILGFGDASSLTLTNCTLVGNQAVGGAGGSGANGGNGQGGGLSLLAGNSAGVSASNIDANRAQGGAAGSGGTAGLGVGGGVYIDTGATVYLDPFTVKNTKYNHADIDPNIDGTYILL